MKSTVSLINVIFVLFSITSSLNLGIAVLGLIETGKVLIVATIAPLGAIAKEIGGDRVVVKVIVPAGSDPHRFVPELQHRELVAKCDIYVTVGREPFLKMLGETKGLKISWNEWIKAGIHIDEAENPHYIWLYPPNAKVVAKVIYDALSKVDPFNAYYYYERLMHFNNTIDELALWTNSVVKAFNVEGAKVVLAAPHFKPLVEFLGFKIVSTIIKGAERKARPNDIKEAIESIRSQGADVIVVLITASEGDEGRVAKLVSETTGVPIVYLAGVPLYFKEDYVSFIKSNVIALLTAIRMSRECSLHYTSGSLRELSSTFEFQVYFLLLVLFSMTLIGLYLVSKER